MGLLWGVLRLRYAIPVSNTDPRSILNWYCSLQCRLRGRVQQTAAVGAGIVDKLPLVVVVLVIELADGFLLARTGYANNWSAAENLAR